ncbi:MAG: type II secretion system ATPase GspE [Nitrospirota bacterium]
MHKYLTDVIREKRPITDSQTQQALDIQKKKGGRIGEILTRLKHINNDDLLNALSLKFGIPYLKEIKEAEVNQELVLKIPIAFAKRYEFLPIKSENGDILVATSDPLNLSAIDDLRILLDSNIRLCIASSNNIIDLINRLHSKEMNKAEDAVEELNEDDISFLSSEIEEPEDLLDVTDDAPIIRLVNSMFSQAIRDRASDIHIEPYEKEVVVRFRIDGILYNILNIKKRFHASITSRTKVMAGMNIAEKRLPQDGRIKLKIAGKDIDIRVSVIPVAFGERIVLRLLHREDVLLGLEDIGLSGDNLDKINNLITKPHGIVLVTGPTGSGKTTTLYSCLSKINAPDKNIITIEDPIEYQLKGIGQIQVNAKINLTFANGLRSILRQDPDVILIGEIRDTETAEIAIQASLTGHLVFSTLHTNDAAGAVTRLVDMKVEPFLVSSSVIAILAQRLVRVLCPDCRVKYIPAAEEIVRLELGKIETEDIHFYRAAGCERCTNTGYLGRAGIYELLVIDDDIRALIMKETDSNTIKAMAIKRGMKTLRQDGAGKVMAGITTVDEVIRVTQREGVEW